MTSNTSPVPGPQVNFCSYGIILKSFTTMQRIQILICDAQSALLHPASALLCGANVDTFWGRLFRVSDPANWWGKAHP
jgi:hypothetical protein